MVVRRQIFRYYKQCVQRHLYARSLPSKFLTKKLKQEVDNDDFSIQTTTSSSTPSSSSSSSSPQRQPQPQPQTQELIFISKNPAFTMRLDLLYDVFPDCRVVCLLRDPCQSIPSMVSYIAHVWETFASPIQQLVRGSSRYPC